MGIFAGQKGDPIPIAFSAGNFTGNASMTWTVSAQLLFEYCIDAGFARVRVSVAAAAGTVAGTPSTTLQVTLPSNIVPAEAVVVPFTYIDNSTAGVGQAAVAAGSQTLSLQKAGAANWTASTTATGVYVDITFRVR